MTVIKSEKIKGNVWEMPGSHTKYNHTAIFPEELAQDHILSWSNEGDLVLDPFMGSSTTAVACKKNNRNFIGFELDEDYYEASKKRLEDFMAQGRLFD